MDWQTTLNIGISIGVVAGPFILNMLLNRIKDIAIVADEVLELATYDCQRSTTIFDIDIDISIEISDIKERL